MRKCAFITGASKGIGNAIAHYFASKGLNLLLMSSNECSILQVRRYLSQRYPEVNVDTVSVDMKDPNLTDYTIRAALERHARIDVLVNSAGILTTGASELNATQLSELIAINTLSTMVITNAVAQKMKERRAGRIFTIASLAGKENKSKLAAYAASKAAIISYSECLFKELLSYNVDVTCISPSVVNTSMTNDGRIANAQKIQTKDIVKTIDYIVSLGKGALIPNIEIHCRPLLLEMLN